jgi:hypothetical protein
MTDDLCRWDGYEQESADYVPTPEQIDAEAARLKAEGIAKAPSPPKRKSPYREKKGRKRYRTQL